MAPQAGHESTIAHGADCVVTEARAAEILGFSVDTLRRIRARGEGPRRLQLSARRVGYRLRDLQAWLDQRVCQ
jgi:predicted DNA-binding transcriptional regulator AlpA